MLPPLIRFDRLASSNDWLLAHGRLHPSGSVVLVRHQTAGRGRGQRRWASTEDSICFSVLLKPAWPTERLFLLNLLAPLTLQQVLARSGYSLAIKFPNDLVAPQGKVAGVLVENSFYGGELEFSVAGFGVNARSVPPEIPSPRLPPACLNDLTDNTSSPSPLPRAEELALAVRDRLLEGLDADTRTILDSYAAALADHVGSFRLENGRILRGRVRGMTTTAQILLETGGSIMELPESAEWLDGQ